jgi:putative ABC transport system permease protein
MLTMIRIAFKSVWHNWFVNGFSAIALAAVLAPLIVLYGLKLGIITGLLDELRNDPSIRRIGLSGYKPLSEEDISAIRILPGTGFVVGAPRSIAARVEMRSDRQSTDIVTADWLPSAAADPLLPDGADAIGDSEIALSEPLAEKLKVPVGASVVAAVYRNDQSEVFEFDLKVVRILPRNRMAGEKALVSSSRLNLISAFADGFEVPEASIAGTPLNQRAAIYDSVRLYARSIDDVVELEKAVAEKYGFRTNSEAASIQWVRELERVMTGVFAIISAAGIMGYVISLWATIAGSVRNSRAQLSLLRLLGIHQRVLFVFPLVQVAIITSLGLSTAFIFSTVAGLVMNRLYLPQMFNGQIFTIRPQDLALTAVLSYTVAAVVALWQLKTLRSISPTQALAESFA